MKAADIKELTEKEIVVKLKEEQDNLTRLNLNHAISPLENPTQLKKTRKVIARLKTELTQRELNKQDK